MTALQIILAVIITFIVFDIYRRMYDMKRSMRVFNFFTDVINKVWMIKGQVSRDELRDIGKKVLNGRPEREHYQLKKDLLESGIDLKD